MKLVHEVEHLTRSYASKGGKDNRAQQQARMLAFAAHAAGQGAHSMAQVGAAHVVRYWKAHRDLADATAYNHWRALCALWRLAGKPSEPPRPRAKQLEPGPTSTL